MTRIITVRGIGEPANSPMLASVYKKFWGTKVEHCAWSAEYGPVPKPLGQAFGSATDRGAAILANLIDFSDEPAVVVAYSGGCTVTHKALERHTRNVAAAAFLADPNQPAWVSNNGRFGIAGPRNLPPGVKARWFYDPADGIAQTPAQNPLRTLADQSEALSLADPAAWGMALWGRMIANRWQPANMFGGGGYIEAANLVRGYLPPPFGRGDHTSYAFRRQANGRTYTDNMADYVGTFL